jgi:hypothetical protein
VQQQPECYCKKSRSIDFLVNRSLLESIDRFSVEKKNEREMQKNKSKQN